MIAKWGAAVAGILLGAVVAFQLAVMLGAPWGRFTQGGTAEGPLPASGRAFAAISAVILIAFALGLLGRVGWGPLRGHRRASSVLAWIAVVYAALAVVLNAATPSAAERAIWLPVSLVLLVASLVTVLGSRRAAAPA